MGNDWQLGAKHQALQEHVPPKLAARGAPKDLWQRNRGDLTERSVARRQPLQRHLAAVARVRDVAQLHA